MNSFSFEHIKTILLSYWPKAVTGILTLVLVFQAYSVLSMVMQFQKLDGLIVQAETPDTESNEEGESEQEQPQERSMRPNPPNNDDEDEFIKNIFIKEQSQYQLTAIYMNSAVINGREVKEGDEIENAVVKTINTNTVEIQERGEDGTKTLEMFKGSGGRGGPSNRMRQQRRPEPQSGSDDEDEDETPSEPSGQPDRAQMMERMRDRFQNMSDEERAEMRQRFRGRGGRGGGRGGPPPGARGR